MSMYYICMQYLVEVHLSAEGSMRYSKPSREVAMLILDLIEPNGPTPADDRRYSLHWLPVLFQIQYKILLLTHKCIGGHGPSYLLIPLQTSARTLRSFSGRLLQ
ncbi:hypothetical protein XENOCAPTIV_003823, partial [Xenoophorus captivus]